MIESHVSGLDGTISELDWNIFSENESDILAIGENALEWDVNGSNVERSGASYYDASGNFGSVQENYIHSNKRLIKCLDEIDWVYILGDGNLRNAHHQGIADGTNWGHPISGPGGQLYVSTLKEINTCINVRIKLFSSMEKMT